MKENLKRLIDHFKKHLLGGNINKITEKLVVENLTEWYHHQI